MFTLAITASKIQLTSPEEYFLFTLLLGFMLVVLAVMLYMFWYKQ